MLYNGTGTPSTVSAPVESRPGFGMSFGCAPNLYHGCLSWEKASPFNGKVEFNFVGGIVGMAGPMLN